MKNILLCWWTGYFNFPYKLYAYIYFITCNAYKVYYDGTLLNVYFIDKTCLKKLFLHQKRGKQGATANSRRKEQGGGGIKPAKHFML